MSEFFNGLILAVIEENGFTFIDCLTDIHGRKYIKLSDDEEIKHKQLFEVSYLHFSSIQANDCGKYMVLENANKIDSFIDIKENAIMQVCLQTLRLVLKKHYDKLYLPIVTHALYLIRKAKIDDKFILIRFLFALLEPINLFSCSVCCYDSIVENASYFNPVTCSFECSSCQNGESFEVKPRTLKEMQNIYLSDYDKLQNIHVALSSKRYIIYLLTDAIAHRFSASKFLDDFIQTLK